MSSYEEPRTLEERLVSIGAIRDELDANPNLSEDEYKAIEHATDEQIREALAANWRTVEDLFYTAHDILQRDAIITLTELYLERRDFAEEEKG